MDILGLPSDILPSILNNTNAESVISTMRTSSQMCKAIKSCQSMIRLDNGRTMQCFIDSLPCMPMKWPQAEHNTHLFEQNDGEEVTVERHLLGRGTLMSGREQALFKSIRFPTAAKYLRVDVGGGFLGKQIGTGLCFDATLLSLFDEGDGYVEVMGFMKHLINMRFQPVTIEYDTGSTAMSMFTTMAKDSIDWWLGSSTGIFIYWNIVQVTKAAEQECSESQCTVALNSCLTSFGHIVVVENENGVRTTDLVKTFTLVLNSSSHSIDAMATLNRCIPRTLLNFPTRLRDCYYIQTSEKIDFTKIDNPALKLELHKQCKVNIKVYHVHNNVCAARSWMQYTLYVPSSS